MLKNLKRETHRMLKSDKRVLHSWVESDRILCPVENEGLAKNPVTPGPNKQKVHSILIHESVSALVCTGMFYFSGSNKQFLR